MQSHISPQSYHAEQAITFLIPYLISKMNLLGILQVLKSYINIGQILDKLACFATMQGVIPQLHMHINE